MPQGIEKVTIQSKDTPTKVNAKGAKLFLSKVPLEVLQNWVLIQLIVTPDILEKVQQGIVGTGYSKSTGKSTNKSAD